MSSNIILNQNVDPGRDGASTSLSGQPNNPNEVFATDVMAFSLHYFENDYAPIGAGGLSPIITTLPAANISNSDVAANTNDLFNGNIKAMQTTLTNPTTYDAMPMANAYQYDQLNRLLSSKSFINLSGNQWGNSGTYDNRYLNTFEYDAMGNIVHQNRYTEAGVQIEDMSYGYKRDTDGNLLRNRLYHINEPVGLTSLDDSDIDDMGGTFDPQDINIEANWNYSYDFEGRLIKDDQEGIDEIIWRVDGKVKEIHRPLNSDKKNISFDYDAMGNRIAKHVYDDDWNLEKSTFYLLDAQGNQMSVYEHEVANSNVTYNLKERHIYGSSSLGILMDSISMGSSTNGNTNNELGLKTYSMSNHLGNVLTVISDIKIPQASGGLTTTGYRVGIRNISDYSPFGVLLAERTVENEFFRRSFNGMEADPEVKGSGNSYDFGSRMLDSRVGRWLSIDPRSAVFPFESNFVFTSDNPILYLDIEGEFKIPIHVEITLTALAMERPWNYALIVADINQTFTDVLNGETHNAIEKLKNLDAKTSQNFALGIAYGVSIEADIFGCLNAENHFDGMKYQKISDNWDNIDKKLNTMKIERSFGSGAEFGKALHAVEDFYAHSNYIELYVEYYKTHNGGKVPKAEDIPLFQDVIKIDKKFKAILEEKLVTGHMDIPTYVGDQVMGTDKDIQQTHEEGEVHHDDIAKDNAEMGKEIKGTNGTLNTFEAAKTVAMKNVRVYINKRLREDGTK